MFIDVLYVINQDNRVNVESFIVISFCDNNYKFVLLLNFTMVNQIIVYLIVIMDFILINKN